MKKIKIILIILIILIFNSSILLARTGITTTDGVNLRNKPSTSSDVIKSLSKNESLEILEESGDFYKVLHKNRVGYVSKKFVNISNNSLESSDTENTANTTNIMNTNVISTDSSNINKVNENNTINSSTKQGVSTNEGELTTGSYKLNADADIYVLPVLYSLKTGSLKKGGNINVTAVISNWVYVSNDDISGWIFKSLISGNERVNTTDGSTSNSTNILTVNSDSVNIREKPSTSSNILGSVSKGRKLEVISKSSDWTKVKFNNVNGYILSRFLS